MISLQYFAFLLSLVPLLAAWSHKYPVPIPHGGRMAVHGWLILPWEQTVPSKPSDPVTAWFVHHTPEFWPNSPHDFQIILSGTLVPSAVDSENETFVIDLPYPPSTPLVGYEFTITPPPPFPLNDLLAGNITSLLGVVYNGSFDTLYERIPMSIATLNIENLTTAVWLNMSSEIPNYPELRYLSYPRSSVVQFSGTQDFYWSHEIHSAPDFDQVIHVQMDLDSCICSGCQNDMELYELMYQAGIEWQVPTFNNLLADRLTPYSTSTNPVLVELIAEDTVVSCKTTVLEEIHCVVGPSFGTRCDSLVSQGYFGAKMSIN